MLTRPLQCTSDITGVSPLEAQTIETLGICPPSKMEFLEHHSKWCLFQIIKFFGLVFQMTCAARKQYDSWLRRDILKIRPEEE